MFNPAKLRLNISQFKFESPDHIFNYHILTNSKEKKSLLIDPVKKVAVAELAKNAGYKSKFGYIKILDEDGINFLDKNLNRVFDEGMEDGEPISQNFFKVLKSGRYMVVDRNGDEKTENIFEDVTHISDQYFYTRRLIDNQQTGQVISIEDNAVIYDNVKSFSKIGTNKTSLLIEKSRDDLFQKKTLLLDDEMIVLKEEFESILSLGNDSVLLISQTRPSNFYPTSSNYQFQFLEYFDQNQERQLFNLISTQNLENLNHLLKKHFNVKGRYKLNAIEAQINLRRVLTKRNRNMHGVSAKQVSHTLQPIGELLIIGNDSDTFKLSIQYLLDPIASLNFDYILYGVEDGDTKYVYNQEFKNIFQGNQQRIELLQRNDAPWSFAVKPFHSSFYTRHDLYGKMTGDVSYPMSMFAGGVADSYLSVYVDKASYAIFADCNFENVQLLNINDSIYFSCSDTVFHGRIFEVSGGYSVDRETGQYTLNEIGEKILLRKDGRIFKPLSKEVQMRGTVFKSGSYFSRIEKNNKYELWGNELKEINIDSPRPIDRYYFSKYVIELASGYQNTIGLMDYDQNLVYAPDSSAYLEKISNSIFVVNYRGPDVWKKKSLLLTRSNDQWQIDTISQVWNVEEEKDDISIIVQNKNNVFGVLNAIGDTIIPFEYDKISRHTTVLTGRKKDSEGGHISIVFDRLNKYAEIFKSSYKISPLYKIDSNILLTHYYAYDIVDRKRLKGILDQEGNEVIPIKYRNLETITGSSLLRFRGEEDKYNVMNWSQEILYTGDKRFYLDFAKIDNQLFYFLNDDDMLSVLNNRLEEINSFDLEFGSYTSIMPDFVALKDKATYALIYYNPITNVLMRE